MTMAQVLITIGIRQQPLITIGIIRRRRRRRARPERSRRITILAHFDKAELMDAIENNGRVELQAVGRLNTGQYFCGEDSVTIRTRRRRRPNQ